MLPDKEERTIGKPHVLSGCDIEVPASWGERLKREWKLSKNHFNYNKHDINIGSGFCGDDGALPSFLEPE